ncbi:hypothetical protein J0S82_013001, partial [Galemys pyrenaicus]
KISNPKSNQGQWKQEQTKAGHPSHLDSAVTEAEGSVSQAPEKTKRIVHTAWKQRSGGRSGSLGNNKCAELKVAEMPHTLASRNGEFEPETPVVNGEMEASKGKPGKNKIRVNDENAQKQMMFLREKQSQLVQEKEHLQGTFSCIWSRVQRTYNYKLCPENMELAEALEKLIEQCVLREEHGTAVAAAAGGCQAPTSPRGSERTVGEGFSSHRGSGIAGDVPVNEAVGDPPEAAAYPL